MNHVSLPAKQGFRQYMATAPLNDTIAVRQAQIREAGNAKAQFLAYCAMFRDEASVAPKATPPLEETHPILAQLRSMAADLGFSLTAEDKEVGVQVVKTSKPKARKAKKNNGFAVGTKFSYAGQNGNSKWLVVSDDGTTKKSKQPAFMCKRDGASEARAWSKAQVERKLNDGTITIL